jgi:hypothetical protein
MTATKHTIELDGETYTIEADTEQNARYQAACRHKSQMTGPYVGIDIDQLARSATITDTSPVEA